MEHFRSQTGELGVEPDRRREAVTKYPFNLYLLPRKGN